MSRRSTPPPPALQRRILTLPCISALGAALVLAGCAQLPDLGVLPQAKTGARHIHLNDAAVAILERQASMANGSGWLFPGRDPAKPLGDVRSTFFRALAKAGLPPMRRHPASPRPR